MLALLEREYAFEKEKYSLDKRIVNLLSDMGFIVVDQSVGASGTPSLHHRLLKQTDKNLIMVTYPVRKRLEPLPAWH